MSSAYSLLDFGNAQRLEAWGQFVLVRPDPTALEEPKDAGLWQEVDAMYQGEKGKGEWKKFSDMPDEWQVGFGDIELITKLAPYKHTGVFPEQEQNWNWARSRNKERSINVLSLFAYTGGATIALAKDGHFVTHVDASKPAITWVKQNAELNSIPSDRIRWIVEDAPLFASREFKRGKHYDAIIIDAPAYGHSPTGKTWRVERDLAPLLETCVALLSNDPAFIILNGYAQNDTPESFHRLLSGILHSKKPDTKFKIDANELFLSTKDGRTLSTGITARCSWSGKNA